jgi:hypothetical protein
MFDVKHLCPRHILVDSVEVVIIYIDIVHDYQKEAFLLYYTQDESYATCFSAKARATNSSKVFHGNRKYWQPGKY